MPGGDRTGPRGEGPMTGGGFGYCSGHEWPGYAYPFPRGGFGRGWGRGRAWGPGMGRRYRRRYMRSPRGMFGWHRFGGFYGPAWGPPPAYAYGPYEPSPEEELDALRDQAQWLKEQLDAISQRIGELETESE